MLTIYLSPFSYIIKALRYIATDLVDPPTNKSLFLMQGLSVLANLCCHLNETEKGETILYMKVAAEAHCSALLQCA